MLKKQVCHKTFPLSWKGAERHHRSIGCLQGAITLGNLASPLAIGTCLGLPWKCWCIYSGFKLLWWWQGSKNMANFSYGDDCSDEKCIWIDVILLPPSFLGWIFIWLVANYVHKSIRLPWLNLKVYAMMVTFDIYKSSFNLRQH